jgi:hypothetical protein
MAFIVLATPSVAITDKGSNDGKVKGHILERHAGAFRNVTLVDKRGLDLPMVGSPRTSPINNKGELQC